MVLDVNNAVKQYDGHMAVDHLSLQVPPGIIYGLLGPNGAGKTTLIRMITGITRPDSGTIALQGERITGLLRPEIGYLPEERGLYKKMKVAEQLIYLGMLKGLTRREAKMKTRFWLEKFDMMAWRRRKIEELSKGMQQKIQFIATILHDPQLIILDEPFSGLDPVNTNMIKREIEHMQKEGKSIIFSTHRMEQVEEICEEIALINQGKNILNGSVEKIKQQYKANQFIIKSKSVIGKATLSKLKVCEAEGNILKFELDPDQTSADVLRMLLNDGVDVLHFEEILPTLNEVFIKTVTR